MIRSRTVGVVIVVLVAGASGTAAAGGGQSPPRPTTVTTDIPAPPAVHAPAFELPALLATSDQVTTDATTHLRSVHRQHVHRERHPARPAPLAPCPGLTPSPNFATPQAAMRYLATAWNHHDYDALCHVTDPTARRMLLDMHHEAVHLRLAKCDYYTVGLYGCTFRHDYPRHLHAHGVGHAYMEVAAALTPGWYTSGPVGCG